MLKTAIVGASGYSGEELIKLLTQHPEVELTRITSRQYASRSVVDVLPRLRPHISDKRTFTESDISSLANDDRVDLAFLALPHGVSHEYAIPLVDAGKNVIDLSADFRLRDAGEYEKAYGKPHPAPDWLPRVPYVIPECTPFEEWKSASLIASPGCYPTSALVPLIPLMKEHIIDPGSVTISSISGLSGAGKQASEAFSFCERNESLKAYGLPRHRHGVEIETHLHALSGSNASIQFIPHLAPVSRGMATTIVAKTNDPNPYPVWEACYGQAPFVQCLPTCETPDSAHVVHTNALHMSACYDEQTGHLILTSAIDNLLKGASGQAIQIMNLKYGFDETCGLPGNAS